MLKITRISFPGLGIDEFSVNTVAFTLFGKEVAWYGVIIAIGMILAVLYTLYRAKRIGLDWDDVIDFVLFAIPIGVLGARLYYVLTTLDHGYNSFYDVIAIWEGGLAIYGGIIAGTITVFAVCHFKKIYFPAFADCVVPGLILAQAIGRWGNFVNGEAHGGVTDIFCRMGLNNGFTTVFYHPTFLYESLWNIVGFVLINIFYKHKKYDGQIFLMVFGWYGLGRMWIEGLRTDSLYASIFGLEFRISQIIAAAILIACLCALIYFHIKPPKKEFYFKPIKRSGKEV